MELPPSYLHLRRWLPFADARRLIWRLLDADDRAVVRAAHGLPFEPPAGFYERCAARGELARFQLPPGDKHSHEPCHQAAKNGQLELLQWAYYHGYMWDSRKIHGLAGISGNLEMIQWLRTCPSYAPDQFHAFTRAARHGHIHILQWGLETGVVQIDEGIFQHAGASGSIPLLQWLQSEQIPYDHRVCESAAWNGRLEALQWLVANDFPWHRETTFQRAAQGGHMHVLQWLYSKGHIHCACACFVAALNGHFEVLKWLVAKGYALNHMVCQAAAGEGYLHILKWLRANGCPWDNRTYASALRKGRHEVAEWARANGCPI